METSSGWERTKRIVDLVSGLSVIATMVFIALQWNEMRAGSADTHDLALAAKSQADAAKRQAENTEIVADSAKSQAENNKALAQAAIDQVSKLGAQVKESHALARAAEGTLAEMRANLVKDQQPYIWAVPQHPIFEVGKRARWDITYSNYGRSPAHDVTMCSDIAEGIGAFHDMHPYTMQECKQLVRGEFSSMLIPPGHQETAVYTSTLGPIVLDQPLIAMITSHDGALAIIGSFFYKDEAGFTYESTFCSYLLASGAIASCSKYNYIKKLD